MLMKIIPIFIVVLSVGSFAQTDEPDPEQAEFIEKVNELRRESANLYGIGNMHELTYNRELAQIAGSTNYESSGYLFTNLPIDHKILDTFVKNVLYFKRKDSQTRETFGKDPRKNLVWYFANPPQTKIGCAKYSDRNVCVFGEQKELSGWKNSDETPGSKCVKGYSNSDGLCVWEQKNFIAYLNEERKSFAKKNNVNNMHKLVFNQLLADTAKDAVWKDKDKDLDGARVTWRYTFFRSYRNASHESKQQMEYFNSVKNKSDLYENRVNLYFPPFEQLVPLQRFVGCAVRWWNTANERVYCLFGPAITFSLSDFSNTEARCGDGYTLIDGLCTRSVPVATTPAANSGSQITIQPVVNVDSSNPSTNAPAKPEDKNENPSTPTPPISSQNQVDSMDQNHPTPDHSSSTSPIQDQTKTDPQSKTIPNPEQKSSVPPVAHISRTTTESELDRRIAKYKANEQDGDLPSEDDLEEFTVSSSEDVSLLIFVSFLLVFMLTE